MGLLLYLNFFAAALLCLAPGQPAAAVLGSARCCWPWGFLYFARNPLGVGMVWAGVLTGVYVAGDLAGLVFRLLGGTADRVWRTVWAGGLLAWAVTLAWMLFARWRADKLCTTTYRLTTKTAAAGRPAADCARSATCTPGPPCTPAGPGSWPSAWRRWTPTCWCSPAIFTTRPPPAGILPPSIRCLPMPVPGTASFSSTATTTWATFSRNPASPGRSSPPAMAAAGVQILADRAVTVSADGIPLRIVGRRDWLFLPAAAAGSKGTAGRAGRGVHPLAGPRAPGASPGGGRRGRPDPLRAHPRRAVVAGGAGGAAVPVQ